MNPPDKTRKVVVYIPNELYKKLRTNLVQKEISVSAWVREQIKNYLQNQAG